MKSRIGRVSQTGSRTTVIRRSLGQFVKSVAESPGAALIDFHGLLELGIERRDQNAFRCVDHTEGVTDLDMDPTRRAELQGAEPLGL